jgi:16S rRNA (guanine(1405)-N(7))-methyltransferase
MDIETLIRRVSSSKKYRHVEESTVVRICREEAAKHPRPKEAEKAAKNRLHQISGAFAMGGDGADAAPMEALLKAHASTRERLGFYDAFFADIGACTGPVNSVMDLACGINPLLFLRHRRNRGLPMPRYAAYDVDLTALRAVHRFFAQEGVEGVAAPLDLMEAVPQQSADVAFLFKIAPLLERQRAGRFAQVLAQLPAPYAAVSFPTRSLGGGSVGRAAQHRRFFEGCLAALDARLLLEKEYPNELLFVVGKADWGE